MGLQKLAPKLIKLFSRGISIPNPIESVVAKATEAVGGGVAKATQAAGEGLDAAKNTGKELVAEVLEKAKVNITAMIGNKQGCIGAAIGSDNIGSVCGDLSSRLLVLMWMTVVFLMSSSLLSILYFLATTFLGQSPKKMARIRWPIIILSGLGTLGALVLFLVPYFFELLLNSLNSHVDGQMDVGWAYKGSIGIFVIACLHLLSTALLSSSRHRIEPSSASEKGTATKSWNGM
ncbi:hypothetical protein VFPPC_14987 [Pochonia chlamydosporia 170]|uniref:Uncharacterized protein n=1 Tax=Pochonia chlamydosporia 170 TaxID=1380566 RepID=A0A179F0T7_METCM|nr:hypothetical protein VFPPC_14987 [Pochonia chlamydosporia 170]OAQ59056.1 hypothetical protein VFPPC_14987 [Pochonia chlamydosporia 170]